MRPKDVVVVVVVVVVPPCANLSHGQWTEAASHWGKRDTAMTKVKMMTDYCTKHPDAKTVPDP